jgi:hypothetical protein
MTFRQSVLGEIAIRSGQQVSGIDVGSLIRRLILFDGVVIKSFRLREVPFLVRTFGESGFTRLLYSGLIKFSCEFTTVVIDVSRDGVRHVPLHHFSLGIVDAAHRDTNLKSELRCLQSITGLKNVERAAIEEAIWKSIVRPPPTYGQDLLGQIDKDLRSKTPALRAVFLKQLRTELGKPDLAVGAIPIQVEETSKRVFYIKNGLSESFGFAPEKAHLVL